MKQCINSIYVIAIEGFCSNSNKAFAQIKLKTVEFVVHRVEHIVRKGKNWRLLEFSLFPHKLF